jgi:hypothetical protein
VLRMLIRCTTGYRGYVRFSTVEVPSSKDTRKTNRKRTQERRHKKDEQSMVLECMFCVLCCVLCAHATDVDVAHWRYPKFQVRTSTRWRYILWLVISTDVIHTHHNKQTKMAISMAIRVAEFSMNRKFAKFFVDLLKTLQFATHSSQRRVCQHSNTERIHCLFSSVSLLCTTTTYS